MKVLLDNNIPVRFALHLDGHEVTHVRDRGWQALSNGELIAEAESEFEALLTVDRNMQHQSSLIGRELMVVTILCPSNRLADLVPLTGEVLQALSDPKPGQFVTVPRP